MSKQERNITILYSVAVAIYSAFNFSVFIYFVYFATVLYMLINARLAKEKLSGNDYIYFVLYAFILPDNYVCIAVIGIVSIVMLLETGIKNTKIFSIVAVFLTINIFVGKVLLVKLMFSVLYFLSFFAAWKVFNHIKVAREKIVSTVEQIIVIQIVSILVYALSHINKIKQSVDLDWVTGSFGTYQCNILNIVCTFFGILLLHYFITTKIKKHLVFAFLSFIVTMITGSVSITIFFIASLIITVAINIKKMNKKIVSFIGVAVVLLVSVFVIVNDSWVTKDIVDLTDYDYFKNRVQKVYTYEHVFLDIPKEDFKFAIIGNGLGNFSSRTALTCTGEYIDAYNSFFDVQMSKYTQEYVYPQLYKVLYLSDNLWGVTYTPYSTIITIKGELGTLGLIALICLFVYMYRNSNKQYTAIFTTTFFGLLLFIDNYMEFPKVVIAFWLCYYFCIERNKKEKYDGKDHIVLVGVIGENAVNGPKQIVNKIHNEYIKRSDIIYTPLVLKVCTKKNKVIFFLKMFFVLWFGREMKVSVHSDGFKIPFIVLLISKVNRQNVYFYTVHGLRCIENRIQEKDKSVYIEKILIQRYANIICVSNMLIDDLQTEYVRKHNVYAIPNGIDMNNNSTDIYDKNVYQLISLGGINRIKGIFEQLYVVRWLVKEKKMDKIELHIWGTIENDDVEKEFYDYVKENNLEDNVFYNGFIYEKVKLNQIYSKSLINLCLSRYDTFNMSVLEAMSNGCLVIVSNNCGAKEIVNGINGIVIKDINNDKEDIYNYLIKLQEINNRYQSIDDAINTASKFTWDRITDKYINIMR